MPIKLKTDKKHYYNYNAKKFIRNGFQVSQKSYATEGDWMPCYSPTCAQQKCRDAYIQLRFEPALRMKARHSNLRMLTISKMDTPALNRAARDVVDGLRKRGHTVESIAAIEPHSQGLFHLHQHLDTDADDAIIREVAAAAVGLAVDVRTGEIAGGGAATEWTEIAITPIDPGGATYPFKNLRKSLGLPHLELNGGRAYCLMTRTFFKSVGNLKPAAKAERALNKTYSEYLEPLLGSDAATKVSDQMKSADEMMSYYRTERARQIHPAHMEVKRHRNYYGTSAIIASNTTQILGSDVFPASLLVRNCGKIQPAKIKHIIV